MSGNLGVCISESHALHIDLDPQRNGSTLSCRGRCILAGGQGRRNNVLYLNTTYSGRTVALSDKHDLQRSGADVGDSPRTDIAGLAEKREGGLQHLENMQAMVDPRLRE
jgi:hypothetical protein